MEEERVDEEAELGVLEAELERIQQLQQEQQQQQQQQQQRQQQRQPCGGGAYLGAKSWQEQS